MFKRILSYFSDSTERRSDNKTVLKQLVYSNAISGKESIIDDGKFILDLSLTR